PAMAGELRWGVVVADRVADLPAVCTTVVELGPRATILDLATGRRRELHPALVSAERAMAAARALAGVVDPELVTDRLAGREGLVELLTGLPPAAGEELRAPIGVDAGGAVWFDLGRDGPHALVGGTTGSGKSELLRTMVAAFASRYAPTDLAFLLVD